MPLRWGTPGEAGFDPDRLGRAWAVLERSAGTDAVPCAVAAVGRAGAAVGPRAFGSAVLSPAAERAAARPDTLFDLASLTKAVATAPAVWALIEQGRLLLGDRLMDHVPEFAGARPGEEPGWRRRVTVAHLLTHTAGLPPHAAMATAEGDPAERWRAVAAVPLQGPPGRRFAYSDVGFMLLGRVVERVAATPLDTFCHTTFYRPLGMKDTGFNPPPALAGRAAATEWLDGPAVPAGEAGYLRGTVHDWKARWLGGVGGHAGLFSTAGDLALFADMLLRGGSGGAGPPRRVLSPAAVARMTEPIDVGEGLWRTRGWQGAGRVPDLPAPGDLWTDRVYGHNGFTGTSLWIDPGHGLWAVLLTNAVHVLRATAAAAMTRLRRHFHNAVVAAMAD